MGCIHSKTKELKLNENGTFKDLNEVNSSSDVHPMIPLNVRQVFKLKQSWKGIKRKIADAGVEMFIRFVQQFLGIGIKIFG